MLTKNVEAEALGTNGALAHAQVDPWRTSQLAIGLLTGMHRDERYEPAQRAAGGGGGGRRRRARGWASFSKLASRTLRANCMLIRRHWNVDPSVGKREDGAVLPVDASPGLRPAR